MLKGCISRLTQTGVLFVWYWKIVVLQNVTQDVKSFRFHCFHSMIAVGFHVVLADYVTIAVGSVVKFDIVNLNEGNG